MLKAYIEPQEIEKLEGSAEYLRDRLLIRLLFHLGCRISEALAVKVDDIDPEHGTVTIEHLKTRSKLLCPSCGVRLGRTHKFCPGCGKGLQQTLTQQLEYRRVRTLPIDGDTLEMLTDFIRRDNTKGLIFGITRHRAWQVVKECDQRAGLPKLVNPETGKTHNVSPHRLRDSFAVNAVKHNDSGDGLRLLQEHLGHASFNTTAKYRKVAGEELKDWYGKLWQKEVKPNGD